MRWICGWKEVIGPARRRGALVWPFAGDLAELAARGRVVLVETYPAEAYAHVGVRLAAKVPGERRKSKRRQDDRRDVAKHLCRDGASQHGITFSPRLAEKIREGFGPRKDGEDPFDAFIGALGMIEVVDRRREAHAPDFNRDDLWEGWILGQEVGPSDN